MSDSGGHVLERTRGGVTEALGSFSHRGLPGRLKLETRNGVMKAADKNQLLLLQPWKTAAPSSEPLGKRKVLFTNSGPANKEPGAREGWAAESGGLAAFSLTTTQLVIPGYAALKKREMNGSVVTFEGMRLGAGGAAKC